MVIAYLVNLEIKDAGKAEVVKAKLVEFAEHYRKDKGTLDWHVYQHAKIPTKFSIVERYEDKAAIKTHGSNPVYPKFGEFMGPLLAGKPSIELFNELDRSSAKL